MRYCVEKGSITVDGVSLTALISTTTRFTRRHHPPHGRGDDAGPQGPGEPVNIEVDVMAKHAGAAAPALLRGRCRPTDAPDRARRRGDRSVRHPAASASKTFSRTGASAQALRASAWTVGGRRVRGLIGPSGCGKSTLLRIVGGLHRRPTRRRSRSAGRAPHAARDRKQFGLVPQTPALLPWRTVRRQHPPAQRAATAAPAPRVAARRRRIAELLDDRRARPASATPTRRALGRDAAARRRWCGRSRSARRSC